MRPERWLAIEELFHAACALPDGQRDTFLHEACKGDESLRFEIETLLKHGAAQDSVLERPAIATMAKAVAADEFWSGVPFLEGKTISHYRILSAIGKGGMGVVYKAEDLRLGRYVALKLLPHFLAGDSCALRRFEREARAASALNHPNICTVYEIDENDGLHFIAIELVEGETLKSRIARGALEVTEVLDIATEICSALEAAHSVGIVHRDIKPSNILLTTDGHAKLFDFGVAKLLGPASERQQESAMPVSATTFELRLTSPGAALGTVAYMSPEQASGQEVDARSDLFSMGAVLYEMATGKHPFPGVDTGEVLRAIRFQLPSPIKQINPAAPFELSRMAARAMEKDRSRRYQAAAAMRTDLQMLRDSWQKRAGKRKALLVGAFSTALLVTAAAASWRVPRMHDWVFGKATNVVPQINSLAVLPLKNLTGDDSQEYFVDGMTDSLITKLAQIKALRIISRDSVMEYRNRQKSPTEIAKELNVDFLVIGSVARSGDSVRIKAQLLRASTGEAVWTNTYQGQTNEIVTLQNDVIRGIASEIRAKLTSQEQARLAREPSVKPEAYEFYLMGRYCWNKRTADGYEKAIQFFQRALEIQPDYARVYAGLADSIAFLGAWKKRGLSRAETMALARSNAQMALRLDDNLAEAHASLASISFLYDWNWPVAENEFRRAIELNPNYASAHHWYAYYCFSRNRVDEGLREIRLAQQLDPQSLIIQSDAGQLLYWARRYDEAIVQERRVLEMDENLPWPHRFLGLSYFAKQQYPEAIQELQSTVRLSGGESADMALLGIVYARTGHVAEARKELENIRALPEEQYKSIPEVAWLLVALDQTDEAYEWLNKSLPDRPSLRSLHLLPYLDPLRADPRFHALQSRVGLP
jgi:serine/threonine protein kinase/tetratricopeptide (TPR) repeat protein